MKSVLLKRNKAINTQIDANKRSKTQKHAFRQDMTLGAQTSMSAPLGLVFKIFSTSHTGTRRMGKSQPSVQKRTCAKSSAVLSAQRSSRVLERRRQHGERCRLTHSALRAVIRARWAATSTARQRGRHLPDRRRRSSRRGNFAPKSLTQPQKDESLK